MGQCGLAQYDQKRLAKKGDYEHAIADYSEAIKLEPQNLIHRAHRGFAYKARGDYDLAIPDCSEVLRADAKFAEGYNCRGSAYLGKKDYNRAIADFSEAIRLNPRAPPRSTIAVTATRAWRPRPRHRRPQPRRQGRSEVLPRLLTAAARCFASKGDHNRAIADYTEAIRFEPGSTSDAYNNRGISYKALGRRAEAIADFRKAQSIDPADQVSREQLRGLGA